MGKALKRYIKETMTYNVAVLSVVLSGLLFALDYYNVISSVVGSVPQDIGIVAALLAVAIVLLLFFKHKLYDMFKAKIINALDKLAFLIPIACGIYFTFSIILLNGHHYKFALTAILYILSFTIILIRAAVIYKKVDNAEKTTTVTLESVYHNEINNNELPILISEKVDTTDLLGREFVVKNLLHTIQCCDQNRCSTIGLVGQWGSGKTTVIEIAKAKLKENKSYLVIDNFEPWLYESQESLLTSAYEAILNTLGIRYNVRIIRQAISSLYSAVASGNPVYNFFGSLSYSSSDDVISSLRNRISTVLSREDKTIVFVMDNLDRTEKTNILSIFKFISIMLACPRIVYLLSYDKKKLNDLFEHQEEFEERFFEKIINQEIHIPEISNEVRTRLTECCLCNLLSAYDSNVNLQDYHELYKFLVASNLDTRQLKQYFNTVFPLTYMEETYLCKKDLFTLLTIQFMSIELYNEIYFNRRYYISADLSSHDMIYALHASSEEAQKELVEYISKLKADYPLYFDLLKSIFPTLANSGRENGMRFDSEEYYDITSQCRICSGKYIDLYFSYTTNDYLKMNQTVNNYILQVRSSSDFTMFTKELIADLPKDQHKEFAAQLLVYIKKIDPQDYFCLAVALFDCTYAFDDSMYFGTLSPQMRVEYIVATLLKKCSDEGFEQFLVYAEHKYSHINSIRYFCKEMTEKDTSISQTMCRKERMLNCYKSLAVEIVKDKIDLYDDNFYHSGNIFGILGSESALTDEDKALFKAVIIKPKNIYRILWDCTQRSIGTSGYGYRISSEIFKDFFDDITLADKLIAKHPPQSEDEQKVLDFYNFYKNADTPFERTFSEDKKMLFSTEFMPNL